MNLVRRILEIKKWLAIVIRKNRDISSGSEAVGEQVGHASIAIL